MLFSLSKIIYVNYFNIEIKKKEVYLLFSSHLHLYFTILSN